MEEGEGRTAAAARKAKERKEKDGRGVVEQRGAEWKWCHFPDVRGSLRSAAQPKSPSEALPQDELCERREGEREGGREGGEAFAFSFLRSPLGHLADS